MYIQILAISSFALSLACFVFSFVRFSKLKNAFLWQKNKSLDLDKRIDEQVQRLNMLTAKFEDRLTSEAPVPSATDAVRAELNSFRMAVAELRSQVDAHSRSISSLRHSVEDLMLKTEKPALDIDVPGLRDTTPQLQSIQPLTQAGFSSLFPDSISPPAVSLYAAEIAADGSLASPEPTKLIDPYEAATQQYQDAVNRVDRQALRIMQYRELNISGDSEDALARGNTLQATRLVAVNGGGSYMIINSQGRFWLFPTALTLESFSSAQPQKGIYNYEATMLTRPSVKKPAEVKEEGDSWVVTTLGVISLPS
ncbi:hypothetical protein KBY85_13895 [Cyanobium sp. BA5m-10]|nr:hypothetical protein [Cyanobium sp. BA5m-10]